MSLNNHFGAEHGRSKHPLRAAATVATSLALAAAGVPLMAGPALAADPKSARVGPCVVTAVQPEDTGRDTISGKSIIAYPIEVWCDAGGVKVHIKQEIAEEDNGPDETLETFWHGRDFRNAGAQIIRQEQWLHNTESAAEESFHRVKFRVESDQGVVSKEVKLQSQTRSFRY